MSRRTDDRGYATAEAAIVLPSLVLVTLLLVALVAAVGSELKCVDAAREAARQAARGETDATARAAAVSLAPAGAEVDLDHHQGWVDVHVVAHLKPWSLMPGVTLRASAHAEEEQP
jgi:hypothetical protein